MLAADVPLDFEQVRASAVGPALWRSIHTLARTVTSPERSAYFRDFLVALAPAMPCPVCAQHWAQIAPTFDAVTPAAAVKWTIDAHNAVNARLGKPQLSDAAALRAILAVTDAPGPLSALDITLICLAVALALALLGVSIAYARTKQRENKRGNAGMLQQ